VCECESACRGALEAMMKSDSNAVSGSVADPKAEPDSSPGGGGRGAAWEEKFDSSDVRIGEVGSSLFDTQADEEQILVRSLKRGTSLDRNIFDDNGLLLAPAGSEVTEDLLAKIRSRGIVAVRASWRMSLLDQKKPACATVKVSSPRRRPSVAEPQPDIELTAPREVSVSSLDRMAETAEYGALFVPQVPSTPARRLPLDELRREMAEGTACYSIAVERHASLVDNMLRGAPFSFKDAAEIIDRFQHMVAADASLGPMLLDLKSDPDDYLYNHGLNVSILSMSIGSKLGLSRDQTIELGIGALFSDIGMLRVPASIRFASRKLTQSQWIEVSQHPIHTANILERSGVTSQNMMLAAYQMHERCDGSGYPRRRSQMFIHPMARIIGIADTYAAMTCLRPHRRRRLSPYEAMVAVLEEKWQLDRQVTRAFVDCMSLFPIGSRVRLSDGRLARVLRSNGVAHTRPVVVLLADDGSETDKELDLSRDEGISVAAALNDVGEAASVA